MAWWINLFLKIFFLLTPFFVLSSFIALTGDDSPGRRRWVAVKMTLAIIAVCFVVFWLGESIFQVFGITLDSFRVGTGVLLMLSAVSLVRGGAARSEEKEGEIAVVPLAIPIAVGPGTIGALMVLSIELPSIGTKVAALSAVAAAAIATGLLCLVSEWIRRLLGANGLAMLSKLTGLIIAAIAAQLILKGIKAALG